VKFLDLMNCGAGEEIENLAYFPKQMITIISGKVWMYAVYGIEGGNANIAYDSGIPDNSRKYRGNLLLFCFCDF
jgi:hypothetical protein